MVKTAAAAAPAVAPVPITVAPALLRSYEGAYQNATTGAGVTVAFDGTRLTLTADGQTPLRLQPIEERRFIADDAPELSVAFAGRGGIIERLSIVRGTSSVRYEREGFGDATSAAAGSECRGAACHGCGEAARIHSPRLLALRHSRGLHSGASTPPAWPTARA